MIKFECLDSGETQTTGNDKWTNQALSTATLANYKKIDYTKHTSRAETTNLPLWNSVQITIDLNIVTFKNNIYERNFASNSLGLIDIKGSPRVQFIGDKFSKNGEAVREIMRYYPF